MREQRETTRREVALAASILGGTLLSLIPLALALAGAPRLTR
jgi:hypothetical protein